MKQKEKAREIMILLAQAGISRAELARHMGITRERVYQMLRKAGPQSIERLKAAIKAQRTKKKLD